MPDRAAAIDTGNAILAHLALVGYDLENGGISRVAIHLANGFSATGHRVTLLLCTSSGERDAAFRADLSSNVKYVALTERAARSRALGQITVLPRFRRWLARERPDCVVATANNISWFCGAGLLAQPTVSSRLFVKTTNPILREGDGPALTGLRRQGYDRLFARAEAVLALSQAEAAILARQFPARADRFRPVFNPYYTSEFAAIPASPRARGKAPKLLAIGRLSPQKNFARLIHAFALARRDGGADFADARLAIAGDGPEHDELVTLARSLGVASQIDFLGFRDDVAQLLQAADRFVLSSNYEGLPAVVIEALGSGCPVISTDCFPAASELLDPLPACATTARDPAALAQAILASLALPTDPDRLHAAALDYGVPSAVRSHLAAMDLVSP